MSSTTAIANVRIFTGRGLTEPETVYVRDGLIADGGPAETTVDARGATLLPGLIDAHIHVVRGLEDLRKLAEHGVTTGLDMAAWPLEVVDQMRRAQGVADIRSATVPAVGPGGNHARLPGFPAEGIIHDPAEGRAFVERRIADGADYIKLVTEAEPPAGMDQETVKAIVEASHEHGKRVVAHSVTVRAFQVALNAGVDVSTHCPLDARLDDESIRRMARDRVVSIPTLTMMEDITRLRADIGLRYEYARDTVTALHEAGVTVLAGTDANSAPGAPAAPVHGESLHHELELLVQAGLSPLEALRGATMDTAESFDLHDRGRIEYGRRADLVLVDGDPIADITATREIRGVWIAGERVR